MPIQVKRVYEAPSPDDGVRILVDRLWPRGISKERGRIDVWAKEVAPSNELRKWYQHDPEKWAEFKRRYATELAQKAPIVAELAERIRGNNVTFVFSSKEERLNNAHALKEYFGAATKRK